MSLKGNAANDIAVGELLGGRYRIQEQLGVGGMGAVFRATDLTTQADVAVKVLHDTEVGSTQAQRLIREARVCMAIQHPSLIRVYHLEEHDPRALYIVMEYLPGITVSQHLRTRGALPPDDAAKITLSLLSALNAIHGVGYFHRDVKGSNVLLVNGDPAKAKLLDLGIAKAADTGTSLTAEGMWVGTLTAMAPELFDGVRFDARSEVYSVGLLLYVMLEASAPFPRDHLPTRLKAMAAGPRLPAGKMSRALWGVIHRALSAQPSKRFQSAISMHDALIEAMRDRDVVVIDQGDGAPTDVMPPLVMPQSGGADFSIDDTAKDRGGPALSQRSDASRDASVATQSHEAITRHAYGSPKPAQDLASVTVRLAMPNTNAPPAMVPMPTPAPAPAPPAPAMPPSAPQAATPQRPTSSAQAQSPLRRSQPSLATSQRSMSSMSGPGSSTKKASFLVLGVLAGCLVSSAIVFLIWHFLL